jgi:signal transduction histidine kinase
VTLSERVRRLQDRRRHVVDSAADERRRIERDLHDGAQARLVALAMDLGMAKEKLAGGSDPERAATLVASAHDEVKRTLSELRDLTRGIHPAVLTDRGLDAALSAVAARCTVPVVVSVEIPQRPPAGHRADRLLLRLRTARQRVATQQRQCRGGDRAPRRRSAPSRRTG